MMRRPWAAEVGCRFMNTAKKKKEEQPVWNLCQIHTLTPLPPALALTDSFTQNVKLQVTHMRLNIP
jgi:hypothetical protein